MAEIGITFRNEAAIRVQAQIFEGRTLVSTCVADPGEVHVLEAGSAQYDIFLRNGATGWEIARKLATEDRIVTLRQQQGRYVISGGQG